MKAKLLRTLLLGAVAAVLMSCTACGGGNDDWYKDVICRNSTTRWSSFILQGGDSTYYITSNTINAKSGNHVSTFVNKVGAESLFWHSGELYYLESGCVYKVVDGSGVTVCNTAKAKLPSGSPRTSFTDFYVSDKYICLSSPTNIVIVYNIKDGEFSTVCSDYSNGTIANNRLYYISTRRDYTVYTVDFSTLERAKLLGGGKLKPKKNIYDRISMAGGKLYVANRNPAEISQLEIAEETVADRNTSSDKSTSSKATSSKATSSKVTSSKANSSKANSSSSDKKYEDSKLVINGGELTYIYFALNSDDLYYACSCNGTIKVCGPAGEYKIGTLDASRSFYVHDDILFYHSVDGQLNAVSVKFAKPTSSAASSQTSSGQQSSKGASSGK